MLTRKQRRELKRQQKLEARERAARGKVRRKIITVAVIVAVVIGAGWLLTLAGKKDTTGPVATFHDPVKGNAEAAVVVKEYSDFQCPACKAATSTVDQILSQYGERIRFEYNDFPLKSIHKNSERAAIAANCADDQGSFYPFHDTLFANQDRWEDLGGGELVDALVGYGEELGLDTEALRTCIEDGATKDRVDEDVREANRLNVRSTPTFFVNDERIVGVDYAGLAAAIEKALAE